MLVDSWDRIRGGTELDLIGPVAFLLLVPPLSATVAAVFSLLEDDDEKEVVAIRAGPAIYRVVLINIPRRRKTHLPLLMILRYSVGGTHMRCYSISYTDPHFILYFCKKKKIPNVHKKMLWKNEGPLFKSSLDAPETKESSKNKSQRDFLSKVDISLVRLQILFIHYLEIKMN